MPEYLAEWFRYLIPVLLAVYTFASMLSLQLRTRKGSLVGCHGQRTLMLLMLFLGFVTLSIREQSVRPLFFGILSLLFLFSLLRLMDFWYPEQDQLLMNHMCLLLGTGYLLLARISFGRAERQLATSALACMSALLLPRLFCRHIALIKKGGIGYALLGAAMLGAVILFGRDSYGAKLSLTIGGIGFQPSEPVKLLLLWFLAAILYDHAERKRIVLVTAVSAGYVLLLACSRDLGGALVFYATCLAMVFMATGSLLYLGIGFSALAVGATAAYFLFEHVQKRFLAFLDPFSYPDSIGYQIIQSLFSVCRGGWFGLGLAAGMPESIPFVEMDFMFSALCEELGILSGISIILICVSCFVMMVQNGIQSKDSFCRLLCCGCGFIYLFQTFLTVGGGIGFIPLTGVTLPLVSYGGSSLFTTVLLFFTVQAVRIQNQQKGIRPHEKK